MSALIVIVAIGLWLVFRADSRFEEEEEAVVPRTPTVKSKATVVAQKMIHGTLDNMAGNIDESMAKSEIKRIARIRKEYKKEFGTDIPEDSVLFESKHF